MRCWEKRLKLERRASLLVLLLAVAGAFVVPAGAAEPPETAPKIWCELYGIERAPADSGIDYRISNLQRMSLRIWVDRGNLRLPEFYVIEKQARPDLPPAVTVEPEGSGAEQMPILLDYRGPSVSLGKYYLRSYILTIPLSEEKIRERFESWKQMFLDVAGPEGKLKIENQFASPILFERFQKDLEHRPGVYRISCEYSSSEFGFWNGKVRSEIIVAIYFEKTFVEKFMERYE